MSLPFADRTEAGRVLATAVREARVEVDLVLGLPRGGVPVAAPVAAALGAELDVLVVRKLGVPGQPELAMGAVAAGVRVLNDSVVRHLRITPEAVERVARREAEEVERREAAYRGGRPPLRLAGRRVAVVDDGLATGATVLAAVQAARASGVAHVVVCPHAPRGFGAVGACYRDFDQTSDDEVRRLLGT